MKDSLGTCYVPVGLVIESHRESSALKIKELERLHFGSKWLSDFDETVSCHKIPSILEMWNCREASFWDDTFVWSFRPSGLMQGFEFHYFHICFSFLSHQLLMTFSKRYRIYIEAMHNGNRWLFVEESSVRKTSLTLSLSPVTVVEILHLKVKKA